MDPLSLVSTLGRNARPFHTSERPMCLRLAGHNYPSHTSPLQQHRPGAMASVDLATVASSLAARGKGLLAADESTGTIGKRLAKMGLENTEVRAKRTERTQPALLQRSSPPPRAAATRLPLDGYRAWHDDYTRNETSHERARAAAAARRRRRAARRVSLRRNALAWRLEAANACRVERGRGRAQTRCHGHAGMRCCANELGGNRHQPKAEPAMPEVPYAQRAFGTRADVHAAAAAATAALAPFKPPYRPTIPAPRLQDVRRAYRQVLLTAPIGESVSGVILFKETLVQKTDGGKPFVECLAEQGVYPGIKVDEVRPGAGEGRLGGRRSAARGHLVCIIRETRRATFRRGRPEQR
eukprot:356014-Chlamydomonas_euryale.AAC.2